MKNRQFNIDDIVLVDNQFICKVIWSAMDNGEWWYGVRPTQFEGIDREVTADRLEKWEVAR